MSFAKPVDFPPGAAVRVLQHELHPARSRHRAGHRDAGAGGVPAAHLRTARAHPHVTAGAHDNPIPGPHPQGYMFLTDGATLDEIELTPDQQAAAFAGTLQPTDVTDWNPSPGWTAGSAISTANDMAMYTKQLVTGGLLDAKTQQLRLDSIQPVDPSKPDGPGYGLGPGADPPEPDRPRRPDPRVRDPRRLRPEHRLAGGHPHQPLRDTGSETPRRQAPVADRRTVLRPMKRRHHHS